MLRAFHEQIREHRRPIIDRKRVQNSLLNISRLPPEILGYIFWLTSFPEGFETRSLHFLRVCNYWYEVASHTPELWSSWGNTLEDWTRCHLRHPETPLDLVLDEETPNKASVDVSVQTALRDRASRDSIRLVHLRSENRKLLSFILWTLVTDRKKVRDSSVESFVLHNKGNQPVDVSNFFANTHFPKLRHLDLTHCIISSWDCFALQTNLLTTLVLHLYSIPPVATTPQLLSLLASNPSLQKIVLVGCSLPEDRNEDHPQVSLPQLKELELAGGCEDVSRFLNRLVFPKILDHLDIDLDGCTVQGVLETIGPYLRDYFLRRGKSQGGLTISTSFEEGILLHVGDGDGFNSSSLMPEQIVPFLAINMGVIYSLNPPQELFLSLLTHTPQEEIVHLQILGQDPGSARGDSTTMSNIYALLPNLRILYCKWVPLSVVFPMSCPSEEDPFPSQSLRCVFLEVAFTNVNWRPLIDFLCLSFRMSSARRLDLLHIISDARFRPEVEDYIRSSVQEFRLIRPV